MKKLCENIKGPAVMSYWPEDTIAENVTFRADLKPQPTSTRDEYIKTSYGSGWCGMPDPSKVSSYLLSDHRFHKDADRKCCPGGGGDDDWNDGDDDWNDLNDDLHPSFEYATQTGSLQVWDGYGVGPSAIDCDAMMRMATEDASLMGRADGKQLSTRVFVAAPSLANKRPDPAREIAIISGVDTSDTRRCFRLAEEDANRFDPGVCAIPINHIVPPWVVGGVFSRDISRSTGFQKAIRKSSRCEPVVPVGADDRTSLPYGPKDPETKQKADKTELKREKKLNKSWCKLETIARGKPPVIEG
jgi:hypothetical protein